MLIVLWITVTLLAVIAWKVSQIERRLTVMHTSWARIMTPVTAISGEPELFGGGQEKHTGHVPRSVLDQIGIQIELATEIQMEQFQRSARRSSEHDC